MPTETVVAVFDSDAGANDAIHALQDAGFSAASIQHYAKGSPALESGSDISGRPQHGFWGWLLGEEGTPVHEESVYERTVQSGGTVVTVVTDESSAATAMAVLERYSPVDIDERVAQYGATAVSESVAASAGSAATSDYETAGSTSRHPGPATSDASVRGAGPDQVMQLAEESLDIGKREVTRGTTRIRRYVVERPVEEQIRLRDERVFIQRRPITDGAVGGSDVFTDKTIEMTETGEEAVVAKTARVVEEIVIRKDVTERVEAVHETVRRDEVDIEGPGEHGSLPGSGSAPGTR